MDVRILHGLVLIMVIISVCATTGLSLGIHVHMSNNIGPDAIIDLHCMVDGKSQGHQQIPFNWTCQWGFRVEAHRLQCEANMQGAKQLNFLAFNTYRDSCIDNCDWKFTPEGVFQLIKENWVFRFNWPH